jgi:hypothetical protein
VAPSLWLLLGLLVLGLLYSPGLRRALAGAWTGAYRACRRVLVDWPLSVLPWPALRSFLRSWAFQLFYRLVFKPLPLYLLLWWLYPEVFETWWPRVLIFAALAGVLNSRPWNGLEEAGSRGIVQSLTWLRAGLVDGLFRLIVEVFKGITDGLEYVLYTVDEWLRFRGGDSRLSLVVRAVVGVVWFPVSYLTRLYIVVLIEPGFNPLKAPISLLAAKFVYPIILALQVNEHLTTLMVPVTGRFVAVALSYGTLWLLPDAFGFLFWEMKENWKLYRANRPADLGPEAIGPYGETMLQLLKPGFHSGTLPRLFAQLRKAERSAHESGAWRAPRTVRERLHAVETSLRRFVTRDVLALLHLSPEWQKKPLGVGDVALASNQVRLELKHADYPLTPLRLAIAEQDGLLVARVEQAGWLSRLAPPEARTLDQAVAGMYKLAGVDLVREPGAAADDGVVVFRRVPLSWAQWVDWWRHDRAGEPLPPPVVVLPAPPAGGNGAELGFTAALGTVLPERRPEGGG